MSEVFLWQYLACTKRKTPTFHGMVSLNDLDLQIEALEERRLNDP